MKRVLVLTILAFVVQGTVAYGIVGVPADPEPTPTPVVQTCHGDCNADGEITVDDIIRLVRGILREPTSCAIQPFPALDVSAVILAVASAVGGCDAIHYRLVSPSSIVYSSAEPGGTVVEEPLSGTFLAVRLDVTTHMYFFLAVRDLDFTSPSLSPTSAVRGPKIFFGRA